MSVTVTDNARITQARHYLADYELHHSQPADHEARPAPPPNELGEVTTPGPQEWETEWRRVPPWRPVRNQLDEQRNTTQNGIERGFIRVMFSGVYMMAGTSRLWRATGGKLNETYFRFKIGGEW